MAEITKTKLAVGIFILLTALGTTYYVSIDDPVYFCEDTNFVGLCWKLSAINDFGLQTRCYYNESATTRYKNCKTGWIEFNQVEFIGQEINSTDIGFDLNFSIDKNIILNNIGISSPKISSCVEVDNYTCEAIVYEKYGINKEVSVKTQYCEKYKNITEEICSNESVIENYIYEVNECNYELIGEYYEYNCEDIAIESTREKQICTNKTMEKCEYVLVENETYFEKICEDYVIQDCENIYQEVCSMVTTGQECDVWKILTKEEIQDELVNEVEQLLLKIADIQSQRNIILQESETTKSINLNLLS